jgi:hypothetical protein
MGFILFLILACGLPGLLAFYILRRVREEAWSAAPSRPPAPSQAAAPPARETERSGYLGGAKGGAVNQSGLERSMATQGADIEHGMASNTVRVDGSDRRQDGTVPIGSAPGHERDRGSQAEAGPRGAAGADDPFVQKGTQP